MSNIKKILSDYFSTPQFLIKNVTWRMPKTISRKNVVFIVGCPRSGTTLLHRILSIHSDVLALPHETAFISYRNIFTRNAFNLPKDENLRLLEKSHDLVDYFDRCLEVLQARNQKICFVEKTPQHVFYLDFLLKHFVNARVIHIFRDGRDCFASAKSHPHIPQRRSVDVFAKYWKKSIVSAMRHKNSKRVYHLKYEDFVEAPEASLREIMPFLNLTFDSSQLETSKIAKDNRSRREVFSKLQKPIDNTSCGRWKTDLTEDEQARFRQIAGSQLEALDYSAS